MATISLVYRLYQINESEDSATVIDSAVSSLNLVLSEAVLKGQTRISRFRDQSVYSHLKNAGIMIGTGGGKYLPDPAESLPRLFMLLERSSFSPQIYF